MTPATTKCKACAQPLSEHRHISQECPADPSTNRRWSQDSTYTPPDPFNKKPTTAAQLIDLTAMKTVYAHFANNKEIDRVLQVHGDQDELARIGDLMIEGKVEAFQAAHDAGRVTIYTGITVPVQQAVWVLYLPPFYVFADAKKLYI